MSPAEFASIRAIRVSSLSAYMAVSINIGANANPMRPFPTLNPQPFFYPQPFHQPQFWRSDCLHMVVAVWEAIFTPAAWPRERLYAVFQPDFSFFVSFHCAIDGQTP